MGSLTDLNSNPQLSARPSGLPLTFTRFHLATQSSNHPTCQPPAPTPPPPPAAPSTSSNDGHSKPPKNKTRIHHQTNIQNQNTTSRTISRTPTSRPQPNLHHHHHRRRRSPWCFTPSWMGATATPARPITSTTATTIATIPATIIVPAIVRPHHQ